MLMITRDEIVERMARIDATQDRARHAAQWFHMEQGMAYVTAAGDTRPVDDEHQWGPIRDHDLIIELDGLTIRYPLDAARFVAYNGDQDSRLPTLYRVYGDGREDFLYSLDACICVMCEAIAALVRMCGPDSLDTI